MNIQQIKTDNNDNIKNLTQFLYGAAGFPVISTLIKAIRKGNYATWPCNAPPFRRSLRRTNRQTDQA